MQHRKHFPCDCVCITCPGWSLVMSKKLLHNVIEEITFPVSLPYKAVSYPSARCAKTRMFVGCWISFLGFKKLEMYNSVQCSSDYQPCTVLAC